MGDSKNTNESYRLAQKRYEAKSLIFYDRLLDAWLTSKMEHDKSLLLISTGGIGLLSTLLTTVGLTSKWYIILLLFSCLSLLIAVLSLVCTQWINAAYIKFILNDLDKLAEREDKKLNLLRKITIWSFTSGIVLTLIVGTVSAFAKL